MNGDWTDDEPPPVGATVTPLYERGYRLGQVGVVRRVLMAESPRQRTLCVVDYPEPVGGFNAPGYHYPDELRYAEVPL